MVRGLVVYLARLGRAVDFKLMKSTVYDDDVDSINPLIAFSLLLFR